MRRCGSWSSRTSRGSWRSCRAGSRPRASSSTAPATAPTGSRARSAGRYDLVVLDLLLPRLDGLAVLRELRRTRPGAAGGDRLGALRPADQAARLRARRQRLRREAVLARRAARARARAAAPRPHGGDGERAARGRADARPRPPPGADRRGASPTSRTASSACCTTSSSTRARSSAASACSPRCGATTSTRARTSSTSACAGCARSSARTRRSRRCAMRVTGSLRREPLERRRGSPSRSANVVAMVAVAELGDDPVPLHLGQPDAALRLPRLARSRRPALVLAPS